MALEYIVVVDFEATCIPDGGIGRTENQIIEFAAILVDVQKKKMVGRLTVYNSILISSTYIRRSVVLLILHIG